MAKCIEIAIVRKGVEGNEIWRLVLRVETKKTSVECDSIGVDTHVASISAALAQSPFLHAS
jgi:hypothetical protein